MPTSNTSILHETAIEDLLGRPPSWLLHSGIGALALVFLVLSLLCAFVRYPDKLSAPFLLQTEEVPLALRADEGELLEVVWKKTGADVMVGDTLLRFKGEGEWAAVDELNQWTTRITASNNNGVIPPSELLYLLAINPPPVSKFGYPPSIQLVVSELTTVLAGYNSYQLTNGVDYAIDAYHQEIEEARKFSASIKDQVRLQDAELDYEQRQTERVQHLTLEGIKSEQESEVASARLLNIQRQREALVSSNIQNELRVHQLNQQILQNQLTHRERLAEFARSAHRQMITLQSLLMASYERSHIIAKANGTLSWDATVRAGIVIAGPEPLGYILPSVETRRLVARLQLPAIAQGRINLGDLVLLEFDSYPGREFGQLKGQLSSIEPIARYNSTADSYFREATVKLPNLLSTSYNHSIRFQYNLSGTAWIITEDRTLLQRILERFTGLTQKFEI